MTQVLHANKRMEFKKKHMIRLRKMGKVPAVLYGHGIQNVSLHVDIVSFEKIHRQAGESTLIDLSIDKGKPVKVLIQDVQYNPVHGKYLHVDFHQVRMDERIKANIELKFVGEAKAVKEHGAILVKALDEIEVECLPGDLVHEIEVDIAKLQNIDDQIRLKDLNIPQAIKPLHPAEEVIVTAAPPRSEEELAELEKAVTEDVGTVEVVGEKEKLEKAAAEAAEKEGEQKPKEEKKKEDKK